MYSKEAKYRRPQTISLGSVIALLSLIMSAITLGLWVYHEMRISALQSQHNEGIETLRSQYKERIEALEESLSIYLSPKSQPSVTLSADDESSAVKRKVANSEDVNRILNQLSQARDTGLKGLMGEGDGDQGQDRKPTIDDILYRVIHKVNSTFHSKTDSDSDPPGAGTSFVRWGKKTCANNSQLLYEGFVGGQHYTHTGGGSNYICLPLKPEWSKYDLGTFGNYIYGTEYELSGSQASLFSNRLQDNNVPCAQCYSNTRSITIMMPAKLTCPLGWTKDYDGYLMSALWSHKRAHEYVCVDQSPDVVTGLQANKNGAVMYMVQAHCETMGHCPPYINNAELTCVVCSK